MAINTMSLQGWPPPWLPRVVYPKDLARLMFEGVPSGSAPPFSAAGVERFVELTYLLSLTPDEGRFPTASLILTDDDIPPTFPFDAPEPLDGVVVLKRLAPTAPGGRFCLSVREGRDGLICDGIDDVDGGGEFHLFGVRRLPIGQGGRVCCRVWILGPGHLIASNAYLTVELKSGALRPLIPGLGDGFRSLRGELFRRLRAEVDPAVDPKGAELLRQEWPIDSEFEHLFTRLLRRVVAARHGGCVVVLPESCGTDPTKCGISEVRSISGLDLFASFREFFAAGAAVDRASDKRQTLDALRSPWEYARRTLLDHIRTTGDLTATDGCVVLSRGLRVVGFGGVMQVDEETARGSAIQYVNAVTKQRVEFDDILKRAGGTRHQSAIRLCKRFPQTLLYVVSQDGGVTEVHSDDRFAYSVGLHMGLPRDEPGIGSH